MGEKIYIVFTKKYIQYTYRNREGCRSMTEVGSLSVTAGNFIICSLHGNIVTKIMHAHMYITHTHVITLIE